MRHDACLCSCLLAEPDQYRADKQRDTHNQESVIKSHDVALAPDNELDLSVGLVSGSDDVIPFICKSSGKRLDPLLNHGTVGIDICSDLEIVELLALSDDGVQHSRAEAPAKVPRDVENGRAVPSIFRLQYRCG